MKQPDKPCYIVVYISRIQSQPSNDLRDNTRLILVIESLGKQCQINKSFKMLKLRSNAWQGVPNSNFRPALSSSYSHHFAIEIFQVFLALIFQLSFIKLSNDRSCTNGN